MTKFIIIGLIILVVLVIFMILARFIGLWIRAKVSNAPIGLLNLVAMWIRKVPTSLIVDSRITAAKAGLDFTTDQLEAHYLAGGHVADVVLSMIAADKAGIPLAFDRACAIDLAVKGTSKTVLEAVRTSINPAVIDCPGGGGKIDAVARDGIQLRARARVTVRTNLDRFVGGATEETIIARVNEGIVTSIGSAVSHKDVLENPDHISKRVLERGLDANTQFEILSIDIADVDVGQNIGATLQASQAEADKQVAQARAEVRRAAAVATEQEMSARTQEMRAKLVEAEALIPIAMAEAFRNGNLGIMDYARYRNVVADTEMRTSIANEVKEDEDSKGASNKV
ncbi:MAG: flotillin-like protein FloA [Verrucomicrobiales bacterium]|jgi:uncharacterized protein YqfA (UPF0365 family)|nr:flotillin-like protein FloA [Verrucomicrobiales bacterium]MDP4792029.1 flotillin-like protein FloA [Verrucomicrobiales bacterium]MDP4938230.1 flotillin-like protein FloA [Verrucomicrobiales bacterium]MDP5004597.1 flotillin-like protein FloA [Verrucomicrobiales bacterium]